MNFYQSILQVTDKAKFLSVVLVVALLLTSCSNRKTPAPVSTVQGSTPLNERVKNSIATTEYFVKKGETLYSIAWRADIDVNKLAKLNQITSPYNIYPGQKLILSTKLSSISSQASVGNSSIKKQNKDSSKKSRKEVKKAVAQNKKQEYGKSASGQKVSKKTPSTANKFSQKIRKWQWPAPGKIIARFSTAVEGNKGLDIAGNRGDKVKAAANGTVVYAGDALRGYGKLIIVKHNEDYLSAYAHNDRILVKEQQIVKVGDVIAKMGKTDAQRVMLHFEVRFRGKSVNPLKYLPRK